MVSTSKRSTTGKRKSSNSRSRGGTLIGMFFGLVIGLIVAFGVAWYLQKTPLPFMDRSGHVDRPQPPNPGQPASLPGKPGDPPLNAPDKQRFEFYKILPSDQSAPGAGAATAPEPAPATPPDTGAAATAGAAASGEQTLLYLQAGAFQKAAEADNLKAKLALMGLETSVQEADVAGKGVVYRVRVGPYGNSGEMNQARQLLSQAGIQASLARVKTVAPAPTTAAD